MLFNLRVLNHSRIITTTSAVKIHIIFYGTRNNLGFRFFLQIIFINTAGINQASKYLSVYAKEQCAVNFNLRAISMDFSLWLY